MSMIMQYDRVDPDELARVLEMDEDAFFDWLEAPGRDSIDVDKAWHGVHAVLTGSAWDTDHELAGAVLGGEEFGEDGGYGPPRYLTAAELAAVAGLLGAITEEEFRARIDLAALAAMDVYPDGWDREERRDDNIGYLASAFAAIRGYYGRAADAGQAMIIQLT